MNAPKVNKVCLTLIASQEKKTASKLLACRYTAMKQPGTPVVKASDLRQAVVERLESEAADNRQAAKKDADERELALKGRYQAALQAAQDSEHRHAER